MLELAGYRTVSAVFNDDVTVAGVVGLQKSLETRESEHRGCRIGASIPGRIRSTCGYRPRHRRRRGPCSALRNRHPALAVAPPHARRVSRNRRVFRRWLATLPRAGRVRLRLPEQLQRRGFLLARETRGISRSVRREFRNCTRGVQDPSGIDLPRRARAARCSVGEPYRRSRSVLQPESGRIRASNVLESRRPPARLPVHGHRGRWNRRTGRYDTIPLAARRTRK